MNSYITWFLCYLSLIFIGWSQQGIAQSQTLERALLQRIEQAQQELTATEQRIDHERETLSKQLRVLEQQVGLLREQSAAARRAGDEHTIGLQQLQSRLLEWQEQQNYQQGLMNRFLQGHGIPFTELSKLGFSEKVSIFAEQVQHQLSAVQLGWQWQSIVYPDGEIQSQPVLRLGPVYLVYAEDEVGRSGVAQLRDGLLRMQIPYNSQQATELASIYNSGVGLIAIDPSLGKAIPLNRHHSQFLSQLKRGGLWLIPILLAALTAFSMALFKAWQLLRLPRIEYYEPAKSVESYTNLYQRSMLEAVRQSATDAEAEDVVFARLQHIKHELHKGLSVVAVVATVAPLLGLLGTVSGMIKTFDMMAAFGSSDADVVSGGIGEALITTEFGLIVAIPSLILSALLSRKASNYYQLLQNFALSAVSGKHAARQRQAAKC